MRGGIVGSRGRWAAAGMALLASACATGGMQQHQLSQGPDSVAVGYGAQAAADVAGAVQSIKADGPQARTGTMADMLEGRVSGLQVIRLSNGSISLRIRGTGSLNMSNEPLVVIDDQMIPPDGVGFALLSVAPADVAQVDVLKDAASTAIYGSRGANGVIVIRTRRGSR